MKTKTIVLTLSLLGCLTGMAAHMSAGDQPSESSPIPGPPKGFVALFDGKSLAGWYGHGTRDPRTLWAMTPEDLARHKEKTRADIAKHWRAENAELVNDGSGLYATTDKDYADFELQIEYKTVPLADSGIYLRGCPQVQIWDTTEAGGKWSIGADKGSGGLWNNSAGTPGKDPLKKMDRPFGSWNVLRIVMVGARVTVWLNGTRIVDHAVLENFFDRRLPIFRKGPIQLQTHGGEIRWRNIFLREIGAEDANRILRCGGPDKEIPFAATEWKPLFNGRDFGGWTKIKGYEIADSKLICTPSGGVMHTTEEYGDYMLRFEFKLTEGANNGLAIHYPGEGNPSQSGVELQILDNDAAQYAQLQPWQYHGSAYGIKAADRGYLREVGEWNLQQVTCRGSRVVVELNGTTILDVDLAAREPADGKPHPGRSRTAGHIGFCGHGCHIELRDLEIRALGND